jgi:hypothetical protein
MELPARHAVISTRAPTLLALAVYNFDTVSDSFFERNLVRVYIHLSEPFLHLISHLLPGQSFASKGFCVALLARRIKVQKMNTVKALVLLAVVSVAVVLAAGQSSSPRSLIRQPIDESKLVVLRGNTHPLAQPQFDRGPAPATLPVQRLILVLKNSPEQGYALDELLKEQQDRSSPNYHKWLTPEEFGAQFGASDADIKTIKAWLGSHGFTIDYTAKGGNLIEFSGTAADVQSAFHTSIHRYELNGKSYFANETDPSIPAALEPAVVGVAALNNFPRTPAHRIVDASMRARRAAALKRRAASGKNPQFTFECALDTSNNPITCYALTPYDFATIYNVLPLWTPTAGTAPLTGTGQTIAIVSDSDINIADYTNFRQIFGLTTAQNPGFSGTLNAIHNGTDPGNLGHGSDEDEADVDTQWASAVAPGATIDLVVSASNVSGALSSFGGDLSAVYVIDGQDPHKPSVIGYSYGSCEFYLGSSGNQFYGGSPVKDSTGEWAQAAAEGITVVVSSGDTGSTGCDNPSNGTGTGVVCPAPNPGNSTTPPFNDPAQCGTAVNGIASTPYNVAVGGTDFDDGCIGSPCPASNPVTNYWNSSNASTTNASVKGYIPEIAYNDSCVNVPLDQLNTNGSASTSAETNCNNFVGDTGSPFLAALVVTAGGGGGVSNCTSPGANPCGSTPSGGYPQPTWQHTAAPSATNRELPDISFFAGDGSYENFYLYCEQDAPGTTGACSLAKGSNTSDFYNNIQGVGGTSVSAEAFVGVMALLNQKLGSAQGLPNPTLYGLAAQSWAHCTSSGTINSACIFYQETSGSIAQPCSNGTPTCSTSASAIPPAGRRNPDLLSRWRTPVLVAFGSMLSLVTLFFFLRRRNRWWAVATASAVFLAFVVLAACGGGGGGGNGSAPIITAQPANQSVAQGATATFSVTATGSAPLSYQWQKNSTNISGATSSSYTTPATTCADNGATFVVTVSNSIGNATSNPATLTVTGCGSSASIGITSVDGTNEAYKAAAGYNMATGLGSMNIYNFVSEWNLNSSSDFVLAANPAAVTTSSGNGTTTITVTFIGSFSNAVDFTPSSCSFPSTITGASCAFSPASVGTNGGQATVSIAAPNKPSTTPEPVPVIVTGTSGSATRTTVIWLTVP